MASKSGVGALSGCVVWLITFGILGSCFCFSSFFVAGIVPVTNPRQVETLVDPILCPADSAATITHYDTFVRDDMGVDRPGVGYEMHCITPGGETVRSYEGTFGFALIGIFRRRCSGDRGRAGVLAGRPGGFADRQVLSGQIKSVAPEFFS